MIDYADLPTRIQAIYQSSTPQEQQYLKQILHELSETGESQTYRDIWLADYKEIPVDIHTFVCDDKYLGKTNRNGDAVYPYWHKTLDEIFSAGNKYEEVVFTGATRIGKSSTAITALAYMTYRLMCLRDPQAYFGKKDISVFSILFFNITKDLAKGVAYREFNDTLAASPWFLDHGHLSRSERDFYYIPEGGKIRIDYGSDASHGLGVQCFCLVGDTQILTADGVHTLEELCDTNVDIFQYDPVSQMYVPSAGDVRLTKYTQDTVRITLEDGSVIEGTADHMVMLSDGSYKKLGELTNSDDLLTLNVERQKKTVSIEKIHHDVLIPVYDVIDAKPHHNFVVCSNSNLVAHNCAIMDECNFSRAGIQDVQKAKQRMLDTYNTISARIKGTFRMNGEVYGKLFCVSSKKSDSDFLEEYVARQRASGAGDHMYVSDAPQWEVMPPTMFSPETFYIAVGDRHKKGFVVPDNQTTPEALADIKAQGYTLLRPPIDMKSNFLGDFEIALRDMAGISVPGSLSFITQDALTACISSTRRNPFYTDILSIGTKDNYSIEEFFHLKEVPGNYKYMPMFIHLDLSLTTDRTGISGVCVSGRKDIVDDSGRTISQPSFTHVFSVAIEAPRGDKISYSKIMQFIVWLRRQGFNIQRISRDQFQSEYMAQLLEEQGFSVDKLSLDRTPDGYMALRSILLEQRIDMLDVKLLQDELIYLQRDSFSGKIDHIVGRCLTGDTKISLVDGRILTMEELVEEQRYKINWVYTVNETTLNIEPKPILAAQQTKLCTDLVKVTLDNGESFTCTPEHRVMLRDGQYVAAEQLLPGQSLMPLYTKVSNQGLSGYRMYFNPGDAKWHYEHRQFVGQPLRKGYVVHHANYDKLNNVPTNLQLMTASQHRAVHNNCTQDYAKTSESIKQYWANISEDELQFRRERCREGIVAGLKRSGRYKGDMTAAHIREVEDTFGICWSKLSVFERSSYAQKFARQKDPTLVQRIADKVSENHRQGKYQAAKAAISNRVWYTNGVESVYIKQDACPPDGFVRGRAISQDMRSHMEQARSQMSDETRAAISEWHRLDTSNRIWITNGVIDKYIHKQDAIPEGYRRGRCKVAKNHKVVSIERIHEPCRVYDLTIADNPNFALAAGVFVHNSKDCADSFAGAIWNAVLTNPGVSIPARSVAAAIASVNGSRTSKNYNPMNNMFPNITRK